jgi:NAD-dependent SIR2 family protein deacetylase
MKWKCLECKEIFTDSERDKEEDDRCPKCKVAFAQMPYEPPHKIGQYELVSKNNTPTYNPKTQVILEKVWLESLLKLAEEVDKYKGRHQEIPIIKFIGYILSAKTILKL